MIRTPEPADLCIRPLCTIFDHIRRVYENHINETVIKVLITAHLPKRDTNPYSVPFFALLIIIFLLK